MKYFIISGEPSGDLHGSKLIKGIFKSDPKAEIAFWGGDLMEKAGGKLLTHYNELAFMGFIEVLLNIFKILITIFTLSIDAFAVGASSQYEIQYLELVIVIIAISAPFFCYLGYKLKNEMIKHSHKLLYFSEGTFFLIIGSFILYSHLTGGY